MDIKVTRTTKLFEVNNDMCHNFYYLIQGRFISDDKKYYKRFKFVVWFDAFDVQDFYERDYYTKKDVRDYVDEIAYSSFLCFAHDWDNLDYFYKLCDESIKDYNRLG